MSQQGVCWTYLTEEKKPTVHKITAWNFKNIISYHLTCTTPAGLTPIIFLQNVQKTLLGKPYTDCIGSFDYNFSYRLRHTNNLLLHSSHFCQCGNKREREFKKMCVKDLLFNFWCWLGIKECLWMVLIHTGQPDECLFVMPWHRHPTFRSTRQQWIHWCICCWWWGESEGK